MSASTVAALGTSTTTHSLSSLDPFAKIVEGFCHTAMLYGSVLNLDDRKRACNIAKEDAYRLRYVNTKLVEDLRREEANIVDQQAKANTAYHEACKMWGTSLVGNVEALVEHIVSARMAMFLKEHKAKEDTEVAEWRSEMTAEQARTWTQLSSMHARISHIEARPHDIPTRNTVTPLDLNERLAQYEKEQQTRRDNELVEVLASLKREFVDPLRVKVEKVEQTLAKPAVHVPPPAPAPAPPTSSSLLSSSRRAPTPPSRSNGISNRGLLPGAIPLPVGFPETRSTPRNSSPQNISSDTSHMESRLQHIQDLTNDMNAKLLDLQAQMEALKSKNSQVATNALPQEKVVEAINVLSERIIGLDQQLAGVKVVVDQVRTLPNKIEHSFRVVAFETDASRAAIAEIQKNLIDLRAFTTSVIMPSPDELRSALAPFRSPTITTENGAAGRVVLQMDDQQTMGLSAYLQTVVEWYSKRLEDSLRKELQKGIEIQATTQDTKLREAYEGLHAKMLLALQNNPWQGQSQLHVTREINGLG